MSTILILFAHPALERSRVQRRLARAVMDLPGVTFHDLYEAYPTFDIDVGREQQLLIDHELIVLQHPLFWYSTPAIVKQWQDLVLEHGWAYGSQGTALRGKQFLSVISSGGGAASYSREGFHGFTIREFLLPIQRTATLCGMEYLPPFVVHGVHRLEVPELDEAARDYRRVIEALRDDTFDLALARRYQTLNEDLEILFKTATVR